MVAMPIFLHMHVELNADCLKCLCSFFLLIRNLIPFFCVSWKSKMATIAGHSFTYEKTKKSLKLETWLNPNLQQ